MYSVNMAASDPREIFRNYAEVFIVDGIEFIRKSTLLEWLQPLYEEYSERSKAGEMVHQIAGTYLDVIKHIKEM